MIARSMGLATFLVASLLAFMAPVEAAEWELSLFEGRDNVLTQIGLEATSALDNGRNKPTTKSEEFTLGIALTGEFALPKPLPFDLGTRLAAGFSHAHIDWPQGIGIIGNAMKSELTMYFIDTRLFVTRKFLSEHVSLNLGAGLWLFDAEQRSKLASFNLVDSASAQLPFIFARGAINLTPHAAIVGEISGSKIGSFTSLYYEVKL